MLLKIFSPKKNGEKLAIWAQITATKFGRKKWSQS
jgi:hypothetical protein